MGGKPNFFRKGGTHRNVRIVTNPTGKIHPYDHVEIGRQLSHRPPCHQWPPSSKGGAIRRSQHLAVSPSHSKRIDRFRAIIVVIFTQRGTNGREPNLTNPASIGNSTRGSQLDPRLPLRKIAFVDPLDQIRFG